MTTACELVAATRACVVAAAGCGKTQLIANSVKAARGRQLVLTHTNAGVEALRRRLRRLGVSGQHAAVDTIAGWSLKYISAYPRRSGGMRATPQGLADWDGVYPAMTKLLDAPLIKSVVLASYEGAFVDEYQDCDTPQHELIARLADILPVRILGDPLQAVFRFRGQPPPWNDMVEAAFPRLGELLTPWRWRREGENASLGDWLGEVRTVLQARRVLSLSDPRIRHVVIPSFKKWRGQAQAVAFELAKGDGNVVAVLKWGSDFHALGCLTGGLFQCIEPVDAKDAALMLSALESGPARGRAKILVEFMKVVAAHVDEPIAKLRALATKKLGFDDVDSATAAACRVLMLVPSSPPAVAADALDALGALPGLRVYRRELLWAAIDSLRDASKAGYVDLLGALRRRRNLTSHVGRRLARCTAGSTLLVKGMEFDHAMVVDTGNFSVNDLYVALTRGSKSLTILSPRDTIDCSTLAED
jgi:hypothetical protein